jgi:hypothetical protein
LQGWHYLDGLRSRCVQRPRRRAKGVEEQARLRRDCCCGGTGDGCTGGSDYRCAGRRQVVDLEIGAHCDPEQH